MTSYTALSEFYDGLMQDFPYPDYVSFISRYAAKGRGLDLFCGTGKITIALSRSGLTMHGSDISSEMLNVAMKKAGESGEKIIFRREKAEEFAYTEKYNLITAVCDGVNYIPQGKLIKLFTRINNALLPEGVFIFDVSSSYKLTKILANKTFYYETAGLTYVWRNAQISNNRAVDMDLTFFAKENLSYRRGEEKHRQYVHTVPELRRALNIAGLNIITIADGETFGKIKPKSRRIVIVAGHKKIN